MMARMSSSPSLKIRADRAALADALGWVARAIPKNPQHPVLAGIRIAAESGVLKVSAFDYETSHAAAVEATVGDEGACIVPGFFLRDAVTGGRGAEVDLVLDGALLEITSGRSTFRARCLPLDQAPELPPSPDVQGVVNADRLRAAVDMLVPAIADDTPFSETRGLHVEGDAERLTLVATDRHRFHTISLPWNGDAEFEATAPGRPLVAALKGMAEGVEVGVSDNLLGLSDGRQRWTTRRYATPYTNWQRLVSTYTEKCQDTITVDRDELLAAVRQVGSLTEGERPILLSFRDGEMEVGTPEQDQGDGSEVLAAEGRGSLSLAVNHRYLSDAIAVTEGPLELRHGGSYETSGAFIVADQSNPDLTLILMSKTPPGGTR